MKANELRLGNYVSVSVNKASAEFQPADIRMLMMLNGDIITLGDYDWSIQPIPLTEEWLLKFGFQAEKLGSLFCSPDKIKAESYKDTGTTSPDFFFNNRLNRWMDCQTRVCIDYVHQLQNLYYALTGAELEIVADGQGEC